MKLFLVLILAIAWMVKPELSTKLSSKSGLRGRKELAVRGEFQPKGFAKYKENKRKKEETQSEAISGIRKERLRDLIKSRRFYDGKVPGSREQGLVAKETQSVRCLVESPGLARCNAISAGNVSSFVESLVTDMLCIHQLNRRSVSTSNKAPFFIILPAVSDRKSKSISKKKSSTDQDYVITCKPKYSSNFSFVYTCNWENSDYQGKGSRTGNREPRENFLKQFSIHIDPDKVAINYLPVSITVESD